MNPFDDEQGTFVVLANNELQHSLWPAPLDRPAGWDLVFGPGSRGECLGYVEDHWTDIRPASLVRDIEGGGS